MDVLTDILGGLRTSGSVYFCDFLEPPWQLDFADEARAIFHRVRRGHCQIEVGGEACELAPGDFVFLSPGVDHVLHGRNPKDPQTLLLCGYCRFEFEQDNVLTRALPRFVLLRGEEMDQWPWLSRTLEHLSAEFMSGAPGSELTVNKLTEVLLVQLLRVDFGRNDRAGIVAALKDKRLNKALTRIHENPGVGWTIETAAHAASMSRSGFARLFKSILGVSFFDYLTRLRMRVARDMLRTSTRRVADVGECVGYQSELSFVKAFKKLHGMTPRAFRLQGEQQ